MGVTPFIIGCDVSKATIDIFDSRTRRHHVITNDDRAITRLVAPLAGHDVRFAFEATGFYGNALRRALAHHGIPAVQINPLHGRRFAQARGRLAKTDRIDATQLADRLELGQTAHWDETLEALKALITRRDQLVTMRADERRRRHQTEHTSVRNSLSDIIAALDAQIKQIDRLIAKAIARTPRLSRLNTLLQSIPGIGPVVAAVMIALLPETGKVDRSAIAALAGLAPMARDSGTFCGKRSIAGGRPKLRKALYQAALGAVAGHSPIADKYRAMIDRGKPPKVALIAIARKIVITANAIIKTEKPYA